MFFRNLFHFGVEKIFQVFFHFYNMPTTALYDIGTFAIVQNCK